MAGLSVLLAVAPAAPTTAVITPSVAASTAEERAHYPRSLGERAALGAFVEGMQADPERLTDLEAKIGEQVGIASYYYGYGDVFPAAPERHFSDQGRRRVLVSWDMGPTRFAEWSRGRHDSYLDRIAAAARAYPHELYVRPWPEMNGDWQSFQPTADGDQPHGGTYRQFKRAWRHVVTYLREHGADNLRWVFNPTADTYAETTPVRAIWPGAAYVDVLGLDGFNWGADEGWGRWRSFRAVFTAQYRRLTALAPRLPVWICEVASKEPAIDDGAPVDPRRSKAAWVRSMLAERSMPRVRALIWFHADKERDWRIDSSAHPLRVLRRALR